MVTDIWNSLIAPRKCILDFIRGLLKPLTEEGRWEAFSKGISNADVSLLAKSKFSLWHIDCGRTRDGNLIKSINFQLHDVVILSIYKMKYSARFQ